MLSTYLPQKIVIGGKDTYVRSSKAENVEENGGYGMGCHVDKARMKQGSSKPALTEQEDGGK